MRAAIMGVIMLNRYAGSPLIGMEYRTYCLAHELNARGHHHCSIVAGTYSHLRQQNPERASFGVHPTSVDGVDWYWIPIGWYHGNGVRRAVSMLRSLWPLSLHREQRGGNLESEDDATP